MPADDYTTAVSGGLKLKGANPSSKVSKSHKRKRPRQPPQPESSADANAEKSKDGAIVNDGKDAAGEPDGATIDKGEQAFEDGKVTPPPAQGGKTEAELRHEERRRKRVRVLFLFHFLLLPCYLHGETLANDGLSARRASEARRHKDAQRACGRTEPLPQQFE